MDILRAAFNILFKLLSFAIWRVFLIFGWLSAACAAIVISPLVLLVEAKAYLERVYFGDEYAVPRMCPSDICNQSV
jgi:hypothetical protein